MSLGIPSQVVSVRGGVAVVETWGTRSEVRLGPLVESVAPGDFLIGYQGQAVRRIPPEDVADTFAIYEFLITEAGEYPH